MGVPAWRVVAPTAMLEVVNGVRDGREITSHTILREGTIVTKDLPRQYVERYLANDPSVRSAVEYGEVVTEYDEETEKEIEVFTPKGGPELPPLAEEGTTTIVNLPAGDEQATAKIAELQTKVDEGAQALQQAQDAAQTAEDALSAAQAKIAELEGEVAKRDTAIEQWQADSAKKIAYAELSAAAVKAEADAKKLTVARADGGEGEPVKSDYVAALEAARAAS